MSAGWDDAERAALVALLRARPNDMRWPDIVAHVDARVSAVALWHELFPPDLLDTESDELSAAARDITAWQADGLGFLTFLDPEYPAQLRARPRPCRRCCSTAARSCPMTSSCWWSAPATPRSEVYRSHVRWPRDSWTVGSAWCPGSLEVSTPPALTASEVEAVRRGVA